MSRKQLLAFIVFIFILSLFFYISLRFGVSVGYKKGIAEPLCHNDTIIVNNTIEHEIRLPCTCEPCRITDKNITESLQYKRILAQAKYCDNMLNKCGNLDELQRFEDLESELSICNGKLSNITEIIS